MPSVSDRDPSVSAMPAMTGKTQRHDTGKDHQNPEELHRPEPFPKEAPGYPVLWCSINKHNRAPWGETLYVEE